MMKKLIAALIVSVFLFSCAEKTGLKDGEYKASDAADERGYTGEITITVEKGKIAAVLYNEAGSDGVFKRDNVQYNEAMKAKSGVSWTEAADQVSAKLAEVQDVSKIDAVSGATGLVERFKALASRALSN
jgi:major membrane immunogen (membrane-anchored lipoprotein)